MLDVEVLSACGWPSYLMLPSWSLRHPRAGRSLWGRPWRRGSGPWRRTCRRRKTSPCPATASSEWPAGERMEGPAGGPGHTAMARLWGRCLGGITGEPFWQPPCLERRESGPEKGAAEGGLPQGFEGGRRARDGGSRRRTPSSSAGSPRPARTAASAAQLTSGGTGDRGQGLGLGRP